MSDSKGIPDSKSGPHQAASLTLIASPEHKGTGRRADDSTQPHGPSNIVNVTPQQGALGFAGRAFTYANSTALVVLVVFFFRADKRSEDNTTYLREWITRQEARSERDRDREQSRHDLNNTRLDAVAVEAKAEAKELKALIQGQSSELRSLTNSVTSLASEVRAGKLKTEAANPLKRELGMTDGAGKKLLQVYRESAPHPVAVAPRPGG